MAHEARAAGKAPACVGDRVQRRHRDDRGERVPELAASLRRACPPVRPRGRFTSSDRRLRRPRAGTMSRRRHARFDELLQGNERVWSPITTAPTMVLPRARRTWASPRCASTIALLAQLRPDLAVAPGEPSRSASSPLPTVPMIVVCRPASRVTLSGGSCRTRGRLRGHVEAGDTSLGQRRAPQHLQHAVPRAGVGDLGDVAGREDVGVAGRRYSSTRTPRSHGSPAARASSIRGRTPTAAATRSQGITSPSPVSTAATRPALPTMAASSVNVWISTPSRSSAAR